VVLVELFGADDQAERVDRGVGDKDAQCTEAVHYTPSAAVDWT
jgi:hypothetical protein